MKRNCDKCRTEVEYDPKYDALFCEKCKIWLERACGDTNCEFCARRPAIPPGLPKYVFQPPPKALGTLRDARWVSGDNKTRRPAAQRSSGKTASR